MRCRKRWCAPGGASAASTPAGADPAEQAVLRQSIRLAFVAALQKLPPKQRAALILSEVLGWSAAEIAESLETSVAGVTSALQRARATLHAGDLRQPPAALSAAELAMVDRYVEAFERYDVDALTALLTEDALLSMPPYTLWLRGRESIRSWLVGRGSGCRGSRLVRTAACGAPAFAQYRQGGDEPWALIVLELELSGNGIAGFTSFLDTETLFPIFGIPLRLSA
jgi:RNA polymerase sigma-70 factor (ECF subfamily)